MISFGFGTGTAEELINFRGPGIGSEILTDTVHPLPMVIFSEVKS